MTLVVFHKHSFKVADFFTFGFSGYGLFAISIFSLKA